MSDASTSGSIELVVFTEPQEGASYRQLADVAQAADDLGYTGFFRSDHYLRMAEGDPGHGPSDAWTTLAALARDTRRVRLGTLVSPVTHRLPGILAVQVANVDDMSGGRVELGLGAGWFEREHRAYGIPFPPKRFGLLEEQLQIVTGLWTTPPGGSFSFHGEHYDLDGAPPLPRPVQQPHPPIVIGGGGPRRTPALAARFGAEYNTGFCDVDTAQGNFERVRAAYSDAGRDPDTLRFSIAWPLAIAGDKDTLRHRAGAHHRDVEDMRAGALVGTPDEVRRRIEAARAIGAGRIYLQVQDLADLAQLELLAHEVAPALAG